MAGEGWVGILGTVKDSNIHVMEVPEGKERKILKEMMSGNFQNLTRIKLYI